MHKELNPISDIFWILRLASAEGSLHSADYMSNTLECNIKYAMAGLGIIAAYPAMDIVQKSQLVNVLPELTSTPLNFDLIFADSLKDDHQANSLVNHLLKSIRKT